MRKNFNKLILLIVLITAVPLVSNAGESYSFLRWSELPQLPPEPGQSIQPGVAGAFCGISNDALVIAGGANFPAPVWETSKVYHRQIYVLEKKETPNDSRSGKRTAQNYSWILDFQLDHPLAYGVSVTSDQGVVCMGGSDGRQVFAESWLFTFDPLKKKLRKEILPSLPEPCMNGSATLIGNTIYLAGGQSAPGLESAMKNFWSLDLSNRPQYEKIPTADLLNLGECRGIFRYGSGKSITKKSNENAPEFRSALIDELKKSDKTAARFYRLGTDSLRLIAGKYNLQIPLNLSQSELVNRLTIAHWGNFHWRILPPWPGSERAFNITISQHNGETNCVYVISGRKNHREKNGELKFDFLKDVYEFNPQSFNQKRSALLSGGRSQSEATQNVWRKLADVPQCVMAGTAVAVGQSHISILGGADGSLMARADELKDRHPGFPKKVFAFHTITNTWINAGQLPANQVTTTAVKWNDDLVIPSGEIRPRVRTPRILLARLIRKEKPFGMINYFTLGLYLALMVGVGVYFLQRNKNTDDYFRGGQKIPWWAAGCSIFATMLSSITYMALPAKAFATDWTYLLGAPPILLVAFFVVYYVLPFFRRLNVTSAYEYLEKRFNLTVRLLGSGLFILFQIGRMAIVMYLSVLALAAILPFSEVQCILLMGVLSIIYSTLGGIEAVVWTDTVQTFVLLGGALLILVSVILKIDGGLPELIRVGSQAHKFKTIEWDWSLNSYSITALWVIILGGIGQNLVSYTSDQAVVQRYLTTKDEKRAAKAIWINGLMSQVVVLLFVLLGSALFVFYKTHPQHLDPTFKIDAVMPLFISRELPVGIAGLIIAGIFAAAQSTISTSMNSTATALVTDFVHRFNLFSSEKKYLNLARWMTVLFGALGTLLAILFSQADVKSLLDTFFSVIGLLGGALGGLFLLGMFTRRSHGVGALIGAVVSGAVLLLVKFYTPTHVYLYALIGIVVCVVVGYLGSIALPGEKKSLIGLTIYTLQQN